MTNPFNSSDSFLYKPFDPFKGYSCVALIWAPFERIRIVMQTSAKSSYIKSPQG